MQITWARCQSMHRIWSDFTGLYPLVVCRQHSSWAGGQPGPAGGDHRLPDSATFLRPGVPRVFPQTPCYSRRGTGNRVRLAPLSTSHLCHFRASSCNYELKVEGLTFSKCSSAVAVFSWTYPNHMWVVIRMRWKMIVAQLATFTVEMGYDANCRLTVLKYFLLMLLGNLSRKTSQ